MLVCLLGLLKSCWGFRVGVFTVQMGKYVSVGVRDEA